MKPDRFEQSKRHVFDSYCKKIVKHEARDHYDEVKRRSEREIYFSELSQREIEQLITYDNYFLSADIFKVLELDIIVSDRRLAQALRRLPKRQQDILLLYYFLKHTDREIGDKLGLIRATVQYQRKIALEQLREILER